MAAGVPVGASTDATRVASYNPWVCLHWLVTGKTIGGTPLYPEANLLGRETALRLWPRRMPGSPVRWARRGRSRPASWPMRLTDDSFSVPDADNILSTLTLVGGQVVHGSADYQGLAPARALHGNQRLFLSTSG
jgi:predicted amidohydrolase YtcJ